METEASRQLVLDYYEALGDLERLAQVPVDAVEFTAPVPGAHGGDALRKMMGEAGGRVFDMTTMQAEARELVSDGDSVVVLQRMSCLATNGRDYSNEYVGVFECADDRIASMVEHLDTACFQQIVLNC